DVSALQSFLISQGYSIPAGATGYFGGQTRAALAAYQKAHGITPAAGYFGPRTRAYLTAHT
ncbi:MAG TPA: peptidoglycan-binding domain-containing protein, partial [Candidatus Paceibacterota bacterium]|nr:peptidoglycan-binding domain-containing protein [Candidatus Paceibacterota bacterium]